MASSLPLTFSARTTETLKSKTLISHPKSLINPTTKSKLSFSLHHQNQKKLKKKRSLSFSVVAAATVSTEEGVRTTADDLVSSILSKVTGSDRGVSLPPEGHKEVAEIAAKLQSYCVDKPVECPLIFGEWDVLYCSNPTSPGGGYRSALGRLVFKTKEMIQVVEAPDVVRNKVSLSAFGFFNVEVSLKGQLKALDEKWIQVIFEPPELTIGAMDYKYGGQSEVKLEITYVDEKIRLGKGSRGSLFVFRRC